MNEDPDVRDLLGPMIDRQVDLESPEFQVDRARVLARMARAKKRDQRAWSGGVALAAAAGIALVLFGARFAKRHDGSTPSTTTEPADAVDLLVTEGSATQSHGEHTSDVAPRESHAITADGELETGADSKARVHTADGLALDLGGRTRIALGDLRSSAPRVTLFRGALHCNVPHRDLQSAPGRLQAAFQVVAPDVTVIDQGTIFTVDVDAANRTTRVSVEEGEVVVRQVTGDTRVHAPDTWTNVQTIVDASAPPSLPSARTNPASTNGKPAPAATLSLEARLLRQGLTAERQGRFPEAIATLTQLITKYPQSPLAPDARAALRRIEARAGR